mgnify:CR=1 FL=1
MARGTDTFQTTTARHSLPGLRFAAAGIDSMYVLMSG